MNALSSTQQTLVKDVYKSNLLGTFPHATWTVSISSSRRFSSYTLSATGVGTVSEAQLQASQTSFAATLTTQLTNNGFTGVTVEEYKYSVDKDDEFCVLGLCGTVLYAAGGGAALLLLTICILLACRYCSCCPWAKHCAQRNHVAHRVGQHSDQHVEIALENPQERHMVTLEDPPVPSHQQYPAPPAPMWAQPQPNYATTNRQPVRDVSREEAEMAAAIAASLAEQQSNRGSPHQI